MQKNNKNNKNVHTIHKLATNRSDIAKSTLYKNVDKANNIDFNVSRVPLDMEIIDPRILTVAPGKKNECHQHAHETFFYVLKGKGVCHINSKTFEIEAGSMIHVPRWANHFTANNEQDDLVILAITDYGLTRRFTGNTEDSYRESADGVGATVFSKAS